MENVAVFKFIGFNWILTLRLNDTIAQRLIARDNRPPDVRLKHLIWHAKVRSDIDHVAVLFTSEDNH